MARAIDAKLHGIAEIMHVDMRPKAEFVSRHNHTESQN